MSRPVACLRCSTGSDACAALRLYAGRRCSPACLHRDPTDTAFSLEPRNDWTPPAHLTPQPSRNLPEARVGGKTDAGQARVAPALARVADPTRPSENLVKINRIAGGSS